MKQGTRVEIYRQGSSRYMAVLSDVGAIPSEGHLISIRGKTWRVVGVTWAVDRADDLFVSELRANIDVVEATLEEET